MQKYNKILRYFVNLLRKYGDLCSQSRKRMKLRSKSYLQWVLPGILILLILILRWNPVCAEVYSLSIYPVISSLLSFFSALFPFSVGDCFILGACLWLILYPFYAWYKRKNIKIILKNILFFLTWIYIWFYLAWGINYFRLPFYERTGIEQVKYSDSLFQEFLAEYTDALNQSYRAAGDTLGRWYTEPYSDSRFMITMPLEEEVGDGYRNIALRYGMVQPAEELKVKNMLFSRGISKVGVTGYMGPFFSEFNLNYELLNVEYPFTYAHELSHRLGIAGEAEANLYAYLVTTASEYPEIRFSGYFSLLGYVLNNARRLLPEEEFRQLVQEIRPEIIELYREHLDYWRDKYSPWIGRLQNRLYNAYLKGNKISSGTGNYSEVIGLLMSLREGL